MAYTGEKVPIDNIATASGLNVAETSLGSWHSIAPKLLSQTKEHFSFALAYLPKESTDEDRSLAYIGNEVFTNPLLKNLSTFGIFDGHNGKFAADFCAAHYGKKISDHYGDLLERANSLSGLNRDADEVSSSSSNINVKIGSISSGDTKIGVTLNDDIDNNYNNISDKNLSKLSNITDKDKDINDNEANEIEGRLHNNNDEDDDDEDVDDIWKDSPAALSTKSESNDRQLDERCHGDEVLIDANTITTTTNVLADELKENLDLHTQVDDDHKSEIKEEKTPPPASAAKDGGKRVKFDYRSVLNGKDIDDALLCEAIRIASEEIHMNICANTDAGTTAVTLSMHYDEVDDSMRVYCANIGDSRCVMLQCVDIDESNNLNSIRITESIENKSGTGTESEDKSFDLSNHSNASMCSSNGDLESGSSNFPVAIGPYGVTSSDLSTDAALSSSPPSEPTVVNQGRSKNPKPLDETESKSIRQTNSYLSYKLATSSSSSSLSSSSSSSSSYLVTAHLMSEDHVLSLSRERLRVEEKSPLRQHALPADASTVFLPEIARGMLVVPYQSKDSDKYISGPKLTKVLKSQAIPFNITKEKAITDSQISNSSTSGKLTSSSSSLSLTSLSTPSSSSSSSSSSAPNVTSKILSADAGGASIFQIGVGYPGNLRQEVAESFLHEVVNTQNLACRHSSLRRPTSSLLEVAPPRRSVTIVDDKSSKDTSSKYRLAHEESFIVRRKVTTSEGTVLYGPEALCGRHNLSLMMTRSLGDRFGPRSCIPTPEISVCTITSGTHARFVIASDGFWDVVSIESVRCMSMTNKNKDPRELASVLALKAQRRRIRDNMRMDDISVMVVDVFPKHFRTIRGNKGGLSRRMKVIRSEGVEESHDGGSSRKIPSCCIS